MGGIGALQPVTDGAAYGRRCLGFSDACQAQAGGVRTEAGVRKASREETAGQQGHDGTARELWGFESRGRLAAMWAS